MGRYILRRLLQAIPVFFGTTFIIYAMVFAVPGDPILALAGDKPISASTLAAMHDRYNLDDPLIVQYGKYMWGVLQGDLGEAFNGRQVSEMLEGRWEVTLKLGATAWVIELFLGIGLGVLAGLRRGRLVDTMVLAGTTMVISVPVFVLGYMAQLFFGVELGWFAPAGVSAGWPVAYLLPALVLAGTSLAFVARLTRTSLVENLGADFVRTATAKGMRRGRVVWRHTLRNSLIPVVTYLGIDLGNLMAGSVVIEGIFNLPGVGQQVFQSIQLKEGPVVVGIITLLVLIYLVANLVVDLLYGVLDPRISRE